MATVKFFLQSKSNPAGIWVRFRRGREIDAKAKTNFEINPEEWSTKKGLPKNTKDAHFKQLTAQLLSLQSKIIEHYNLSVGKSTINSEWLKEFINPTVTKSGLPESLVEYFDYYLSHKKTIIKPSTHTKLSGVKNLLVRYQKARKSTVLIKDIGLDFKIEFEAYCKGDGYGDNTIARLVKFIKTICLDAQKNGIDTHKQLSSIRTKNKIVDKVYLNFQELAKIESKEMPHDYLDNARDWLLISCETGQRVSDFLRFKKEWIRTIQTEKGEKKIIEFTQTKTGKLMAIPLSEKVQKILEKRNGEFPRKISSQRYNEYLKQVCKLAGINSVVKGGIIDKETNRKVSGMFEKWQLITSHVGRRSLATNYYGIKPTSVLMHMTGHSSESTFRIYIGKSDTERAVEAALWF